MGGHGERGARNMAVDGGERRGGMKQNNYQPVRLYVMYMCPT